MMTVRKIEMKGSKASVHMFTGIKAKSTSQIAETILNNVPFVKDTGYAGFRTKAGLRKHLGWALGKNFCNIEINDKVLAQVIDGALKKCISAARTKLLHVFVFPTFDNFVRDKMGGASGFSFWKNTMLLYVNPVDGWQDALHSAVCHEFAHAVMLNYSKRETLLDDLIFEGVAEHFREAVAGGKAPWVVSLSNDEAKKFFGEVQSKVNSADVKIIREVFYGTGKYPLWAGYAIGYQIVGNYLAKPKAKRDWNAIFRTAPKTIFSQSGWAEIR